MIILDYSQVALSNIFQFQNDLKKDKASPDAVNIIRHAILTGIKFYKKKYGREYGDVVLACDGKQYWRKDIFPYYKASRSKTREKSDLDWKLIFDTISQIREDIAEHFPYHVVHLDHVEGDDVIATLCKWTQTNGMVVFVTEGARQKKMTSKRLADFIEFGRDACINEEEQRNWDRNNLLINLDNIPAAIQEQILDTYISNKPKGDKMSIYNYLVKHRCRLLLDEIEEF